MSPSTIIRGRCHYVAPSVEVRSSPKIRMNMVAMLRNYIENYSAR